jgi:hypothetical protein
MIIPDFRLNTKNIIEIMEMLLFEAKCQELHFSYDDYIWVISRGVHERVYYEYFCHVIEDCCIREIMGIRVMIDCDITNRISLMKEVQFKV